jgi:UDP-N-acetylmuramate dehydrogenase
MIQNKFSLLQHNTFGIDVKAKSYTTFSSTKELKKILSSNDVKGKQKLILGGGSNILFTKDFDGVVLKNRIKGIEIEKENDEFVWVKANAGESWDDLVQYAITNGYGGIENLSLIPGSVGAAPMQNIGAYGVEIKDVFFELEAMHIDTTDEVRFTKKRCQFGYRDSIFKNFYKDQYVITNVTLRLTKKPILNLSYGAIQTELHAMGIYTPNINAVSKAICKIRESKLPNPKVIGNSGSFFKNPIVSKEKFDALKTEFPEIASYKVSKSQVKLAAGWLIDNAGWKGKTVGNCGVHKDQALVLVNNGGANGADVFKLSEDIMADIKTKYDVVLEREVNIL